MREANERDDWSAICTVNTVNNVRTHLNDAIPKEKQLSWCEVRRVDVFYYNILEFT